MSAEPSLGRTPGQVPRESREPYLAILHNRGSGLGYISHGRTCRRDRMVVSEYVRFLGPCRAMEGLTDAVIDSVVYRYPK